MRVVEQKMDSGLKKVGDSSSLAIGVQFVATQKKKRQAPLKHQRNTEKYPEMLVVQNVKRIKKW